MAKTRIAGSTTKQGPTHPFLRLRHSDLGLGTSFGLGYLGLGYFGLGYSGLPSDLGIWHLGIWYLGIWYLGIWYLGIWYLGIWYLGIWYLGIWYLGIWYLGIWYLGIWVFGYFELRASAICLWQNRAQSSSWRSGVISIRGLTVRAGDFLLKDVDLDVPTGDYAALMGKTGSGKTTLLEAVTGLKPILAGSIVIDGLDVTRLRPAERNIGYVPQDGALFAGMSVRDHLAFSLVIRRRKKVDVDSRVTQLAKMLEITHLLGRTTAGLSGGERQRVALGRALAFRPRTLCLDEPLSALDDTTRSQMYQLLDHVRHQTGVTTLHVTHSLKEARHLADVVFRIEHGGVSLIESNGAEGQRV